MSKKIKQDLAAENNGQIRLVPQLIGNRADEFLMMIRQLEELGFTSVNLNFGCPSGTVVSKRKGAGFLADPKELEMLLEEVLENSPLAVSVRPESESKTQMSGKLSAVSMQSFRWKN